MEGMPALLTLNAAGGQPAPVTEPKCRWRHETVSEALPRAAASSQARRSSGAAAQTPAGASPDIRGCHSSCSSQSPLPERSKEQTECVFSPDSTQPSQFRFTSRSPALLGLFASFPRGSWRGVPQPPTPRLRPHSPAALLTVRSRAVPAPGPAPAGSSEPAASAAPSASRVRGAGAGAAPPGAGAG